MLIDKETLLEEMRSLEEDPRNIYPQWREAVALTEMQTPAIKRMNKVMEAAFGKMDDNIDSRLGFLKAWMLALLVVKDE